MPDITKQLSGIIVNSLCQDCIKHPDHLTCHSYYGLHLFQWILFPCPIILMDCTELRILSYQRDRCFIQDIAQSLSSTVTDPAFSVVLTGIICNNRISCKLLQLLWVIKTSNVCLLYTSDAADE
mgnify:CR=1 FL=1